MEVIGIVSAYFESGDWACYGSSALHDVEAWDQLERIAPPEWGRIIFTSFERIPVPKNYLPHDFKVQSLELP
jgi:hypothetical protein